MPGTSYHARAVILSSRNITVLRCPCYVMLNGCLKGLLLTKLPVVYDLLTKVTLKILKALVGIFNKKKALHEVSLTALVQVGPGWSQ